METELMTPTMEPPAESQMPTPPTDTPPPQTGEADNPSDFEICITVMGGKARSVTKEPMSAESNEGEAGGVGEQGESEPGDEAGNQKELTDVEVVKSVIGILREAQQGSDEAQMDQGFHGKEAA